MKSQSIHVGKVDLNISLLELLVDFLSCKAEKVSDVYIAEFNNIQNTQAARIQQEKSADGSLVLKFCSGSVVM